MGRVARGKTFEIGVISRSLEEDSMRCLWESEERHGFCWAEVACREGEVKSIDQKLHRRYAHSSSVTVSTSPICGQFVNMHQNVKCACALTAYGRMITSMTQIYTHPISKPFETWLCSSSHLYFLRVSSARWPALAHGKLVGLKLEKALAYFCFVSCPFAFALRTCLAHAAKLNHPSYSSQGHLSSLNPQSTHGHVSAPSQAQKNSPVKLRLNCQPKDSRARKNAYCLNRLSLGLFVTQQYCANR